MDSFRRRLMPRIIADNILYVDLGLPSGLLWATCNIGADNIEEAGLYFSWANVDGHVPGDGYNFGNTTVGLPYSGTNGYTAKNDLSADQSFSPDSGYDAARYNLGGTWRMPTNTEIIELYDNTTWQYTSVKGVNGILHTSTINGNTIFFPIAGHIESTSLVGQEVYLWSSTLQGKGTSNLQNLAYIYSYRNNTVERGSCILVHLGCPIRPVRYPDMEYVDLGLPSGIKWATCNLGARQPTDAGLYFSWGNVEGHAKGSGYNFNSTTYNSTPGKALTGDIPVNATYDAARCMLGDGWRLPTRVEFKELYDNTDSEWVSNYNGTGVKGRKFMKKSDHSVYVFFPACGKYDGTTIGNWVNDVYYWSSTLYNSNYAYILSSSSGSTYVGFNDSRNHGLPCRAVMDTV